MSMFDMYKSKKKRAVDPNAPPRPNLFSHEKKLKETTSSLEELQQENRLLKMRLEALESKMVTQTQYLNHLHQVISSKLRG
jgi:predicted RNase H-like nuclease (RuvC/YqgF family)